MSIEHVNYPVSHIVANIIREKGLKQCTVAEKANLNPQQLNDMLNGRRVIKACDIPRLANALGVCPNQLFSETESNT